MRLFKPRICAIVDAYSSGNQLARAFRKRGFRSIHVQSKPEMLPLNHKSFRPQDFVGEVRHSGDFEETLRLVREQRPEVVLAGAEDGVPLADRLSEALELPTNGSASSAARRNKFDMAETLRNAGLRSIRSKLSMDLRETLDWIHREAAYPVVVKPPESTGTDGVTLCRSDEEVERAFAALLGTHNRLGILTREALVQSFLEGEEHLVNTVSCDGAHVVTDVWRSVKTAANGHHFIYDHVDLLDSEKALHAELKDYVLRVLDALGIRQGPAHSEVIVTDEGPVLLEVGARLCGGSVQELARECLGIDPLELTVDAFTDPARFAGQVGVRHRMKKHVRLVSLISNEEGFVRAVPGLDRAKELRSYFRSFMAAKPGTRLEKTVDIFTCPGDIALIHEDEAVIREDYRTIRDLEKEQFFELENRTS